MAPDPAWFYSSLSQVTAALVGFIGGFLVLRLQQILMAWQSVAADLETSQYDWVVLTNRMSAFDYTTPRPEVDEARERAVLRWTTFQRAYSQRKTASIPKELVGGMVFVAALTATGIIWPLASLDAPTAGRQAQFLVPWTFLVILAQVMFVWRVLHLLRALKDVAILSPVRDELDRLRAQHGVEL